MPVFCVIHFFSIHKQAENELYEPHDSMNSSSDWGTFLVEFFQFSKMYLTLIIKLALIIQHSMAFEYGLWENSIVLLCF